MRCCAPGCTNRTEKIKKASHSITFHLFPRDPNQRAAWIEAVGLKFWQPTDRTVICSDHFKEENFYETKKGLRRINNGAVPFIDEGLDAPAVKRICKICLSLDNKMHQLQSFKLDKMYENLIPLLISENNLREKLPNQLCWECAARLRAAASFKDKALFSNKLLHDILKAEPFIKVRDIITIHRKHGSLKSTLVAQKRCDSEETEKPGKHKALVKTEETEIISHDEIEIDFKDLISDDGIKDEENNKLIAEHLTDDIKNEGEIVSRQVEDRRNDIFDDDNNCSDDSAIATNENSIIDNKNVDLYTNASSKMTEIVVFGDIVDNNVDPVEKKEDAVRNTMAKTSENNPSGNRRRGKKKPYVKPKLPIDETIISISTISKEQLLQEEEARKESTRYKDAHFKCNICYKWFSTKDKLTRHAVKHSEKVGAYQCEICKVRLKQKGLLTAHMINRHTNEYSCKLCPYVTRARYNALEHVRLHCGKKFNCPQCPLEFEKHTTLLNHLRLKHLSDAVCELCGYTFVSKTGVNTHKRIKHSLIDKHITLDGPHCDVCDVKFLSQKVYDRHLGLSSKHISSFDDPNRLNNDSSLKSRRLVGMAERAFQSNDPSGNHPVDCEQCGVVLPNLRAYTNHFRTTHPDINRTKFPNRKKPRMCEHCGKIFTTNVLLINHQWVHTGKKRFQCDHCHKTFAQKAVLISHIMTHGTAPRRYYDCRVCGKRFCSASGRIRHTYLHMNQKPFKCETCEKSFPSSHELRAHVDHVHHNKPRPKRVWKKRTRNH